MRRTSSSRLFCALVVLALGCAAATSAASDDPRPHPLIIAHRGASGWLPEHSLAAYAAAYALDADYLEPDVVLTADGVLICSHDLTLEEKTNIAEVYPGRGDDEGRYFASQFTWDELQRVERKTRKGQVLPGHRIATLDELLALIAHLNEITGREVGVIPEPKAPDRHRAWGLPIERPLVEALARWGYRARSDKVVIQCFDLESLRVIREELGSGIRLVYLFGDPLEPGVLEGLAGVVDGIGPNHALIEGDTLRGEPGELLTEARARGLTVYAWTFGDEPERLRRFLHHWRVDGVFADYVDTAVEARDGADDD